MCGDDRFRSADQSALTFETMLTDPMIRLVMDSDGVTMAEMVTVLAGAREALAARERQVLRTVMP